MITLASHDACTGCTACKAICPRVAIAMQADEEGFLRPAIDTAKCVQCHACERVCPTLHPKVAAERQICYAARTRDAETLRTSASGGLFPELAKPILAEGGVVFGCVWEPETMLAVHAKTETLDGLRAMQGSKYLQSDLRDTFKEAKAELLKGRQVLFTGTPCQIAGLKAFLGKSYENLLAVEIICHSAPSPAIWKCFLSALKLPRPAVSASFREKSHGGSWSAGNFTLCDESGRALYRQRFGATPFAHLFFCHLISRPSCYQCTAKQGASGADLTIGDLWGIEHVLPAWNDDRGTSLVIVHTDRGAQCLPKAIDLYPLETEPAQRGNPYYLRPTPCHPKRAWAMPRLLATQHFARFARTITQGPLPKRLLLRARVCAGKIYHCILNTTRGGVVSIYSPTCLSYTSP